jgi:hypothetical protein
MYNQRCELVLSEGLQQGTKGGSVPDPDRRSFSPIQPLPGSTIGDEIRTIGNKIAAHNLYLMEILIK